MKTYYPKQWAALNSGDKATAIKGMVDWEAPGNKAAAIQKRTGIYNSLPKDLGKGGGDGKTAPTPNAMPPVVNGAPSIVHDEARGPGGFGKLSKVDAFIWHHTGGRGNAEGVYNTFKQRGLGAHYVMERDGTIHEYLPDGTKGRHIKNGSGLGAGLSNRDTEGMEIIAKNDKDVTPAQRASARQFSQWFASTHPGVKFFGHGEVNPGHKEPTEGLTAANDARYDQEHPHRGESGGHHHHGDNVYHINGAQDPKQVAAEVHNIHNKREASVANHVRTRMVDFIG